MPETLEKKLIFKDNREMVAVLGKNDEYLKLMDDPECRIIPRGNELLLTGTEAALRRMERAFSELLYLYRQGLPITTHDVTYTLKLVRDGKEEALHQLYTDTVITTYRGKQVKAKTLGQWQYLKTIGENQMTIALGPAGTGKTYLAVAMAVKALKNHEVERIILTRPAVEAGEKLGFLPGDLQEKVDPYLRPLYDALYEMLGMESFQKYLTRGTIEVAPLAYMRGRTLSDAFIIIDEAQNTTAEQMRMALTRFGFGSKLVVTGDDSQVDLPPGKQMPPMFSRESLALALFTLRTAMSSGMKSWRPSSGRTKNTIMLKRKEGTAMIVTLENNQEKVSIPEALEADLTKAMNVVAELEALSPQTEVDITLVDDAAIHELNRTYRGIDRPTDVLSFALDEGEEEPEVDDDEIEHLLGDVIISAPTAVRQGEEYGHGLEREMTYLAVHGMLHLLGYDHMEEKDKLIMRKREEEVLRRLDLAEENFGG